VGEVLCMYVCTLSAALWVLANGSGVEITTVVAPRQTRCGRVSKSRPSCRAYNVFDKGGMEAAAGRAERCQSHCDAMG
jgi:hypothetical protein